MNELGVEPRLKSAIEGMIEGLQIVDHQWRYVYLNLAAAHHGRRNRDELIGRTMMESYPGIEKTDVFAELRHTMTNRETRRVETEFVFPDGEKCWFEVIVEPHEDGILIHSLDISERRKLEDQLRHAQKMEALGRVAGGIAHDFNNKLGIMLAYCEMALDSGPGPQLESFVHKILKAVNSSAALTKQLLAFSRRQVLDVKPLDLNLLLQELHPTLVKLMGESIQVQNRLSTEIGDVRVDIAHMEQVLLNLCINARDAMPNGGSLTLETKSVYLDKAFSAQHPGVKVGPYVMLVVTDSGTGMSDEVMAKLFEPFFTTKVRGLGSGLGLAMVHGFVSQCNGHIWVYSEPELGTAFRIYLPQFQKTESAAETKPSAADEQSRIAMGECILLCEDDLLLREAYEVALSAAGYRVVAAADASEAEIAFQRLEGRVDLLLTDIVLPKMSGRDLASRLAKLKPEIKIVFMSGHTELVVSSQAILDEETVLLRKPISIGSLLLTVRHVLDGSLRKGVIHASP